MFKLFAKLVLAAYAAVVAVIGQLAALDSLDLGYSVVLVAITSISAFSLAAAVLIVVLDWNAPVVLKFWKPVFWLSCFDLVVGTTMDWGHMSGSFGALLIVMFVVGFLAPAYYFSYALAYKSRLSRSNNGA